MKLLLDQNISSRVLDAIAPLYPGSGHVRHFGLEWADDDTVWEYAREHGFIIVSKDSDFRQRSFLFGFPPKVIWIRAGNCSTDDIERILREHHSEVQGFGEDPVHAFLILSLPAKG